VKSCVMFLIVAFIWGSPVAVPAQETIELKGYVEDAETRLPIKLVAVGATGDQGKASTTTDSNGQFILPLSQNVKSGAKVRIWFSKEGYEPFEQWVPASSDVLIPISLRRLKTRSSHPQKNANSRGPESQKTTPTENQMTSDSATAFVGHPIPGPDWRRFSDWQKTVLTAFLAHSEGQKLTIFSANTPESFNYANQFRDILSGPTVGWDVDGPYQALPDQVVMDVMLSFNDQYKNTLQKNAAAFKQVLGFVGVKMRDISKLDPNVDPDEIVLWVGPASPDGPHIIPEPPEVACRVPLSITVTSLESPPDPRLRFFKQVTVESGTQAFRRGDRLRVFFDSYVLGIGWSTADMYIAADRTKGGSTAAFQLRDGLGPDEAAQFVVGSDADFHVRCVEQR